MLMEKPPESTPVQNMQTNNAEYLLNFRILHIFRHNVFEYPEQWFLYLLIDKITSKWTSGPIYVWISWTIIPLLARRAFKIFKESSG